MKYKIGQLKAGKERKSTSHHWNGGTIINSQGYIIVYCPEHPNCDNSGYIKEHRLVMERHLNRFLDKQERVHHINEIKTDNRIENLQLFANESEHQSNISHRYKEFVCKGREKEYRKQYYQDNKEHIKENSNRYRKQFGELVNIKSRIKNGTISVEEAMSELGYTREQLTIKKRK